MRLHGLAARPDAAAPLLASVYFVKAGSLGTGCCSTRYCRIPEISGKGALSGRGAVPVALRRLMWTLMSIPPRRGPFRGTLVSMT